MSKILRIGESNLEFDFTSPQQHFFLHWDRFLKTDLGQIHQAIPWDSLVKSIGLKSIRKGRKSIFNPQGKLGLMFLKNYTGFSDRMLIERLSSDYGYQFFCGIYLPPTSEKIDFKVVSKIRVELARKLNIHSVQMVLAKAWKPYIEQPQIMLTDATCYETYMRYPTSVKLLWESNEWLYGQMKKFCKAGKLRMPRNKYADQKSKYLNYQKSRKKSWKKTKKRIRSLLYLLNKLVGQIQEVSNQIKTDIVIDEKYYKRMAVIKKVLKQEIDRYNGKDISRPILSLDKTYIRPIVRGKETKRVEFGAKANLLQFDGINFIETISHNAFNEGTKLISSIRYGRSLMRQKVTHLSADKIYATNKNRSYCTHQNVVTNFVAKGRKSKIEDQKKVMRKVLDVHRATRMEGAFGTQKNHYNLQKIKARTAQTELLWIFFGVHTANAVQIAKRMALQKSKVA